MKVFKSLFVLATAVAASVGYGERVSVKVALEDELHRPIAGEKVKVMFWNAKNSRGPGDLWGTTDSKGEFSCVVDTGFVVKFFAGGKGTKYGWVRRECGVVDGKCHTKMMLKIREGEQDFISGVCSLRLGEAEKRVGFDFLYGDFVGNGGQGKSADIYISMDYKTNSVGSRVGINFELEPTGDGTGCVGMARCLDSEVEYVFDDNIPVDGWTPFYEMKCPLNERQWGASEMKPRECALFRVRPKEVDGEIKFNYVVVSGFSCGSGYNETGNVMFKYVMYLKKGAKCLKTKPSETMRYIARQMVEAQESGGGLK